MLARLTAVLCSLVLVAGALTAAYQRGARDAAPAPRGQAGATATIDDGDLDLVEEVLRRLDSEAVRAPDDQKLVEGAVEGLIEALDDPYAEYYAPSEFAAFNQSLDGEVSGVGLLLLPPRENQPNGLTVAEVLEGTPAERAGVEKGERIVSVDGTDVRHKPTEVVVEMVKGEPGTDVTLGLAGGSRGRREVRMTRAVFDVPNLESEMLADGAGYVQLQQFTEGAGQRVRRAVDRLVADGAKGIVLDLRGNPGGLLGEAVDIASVFIEDGPIVTVRERDADPKGHTATGDALEDLPLVVLVDQDSASASEIVAGAISDADRGTLVGVTTFGKGTVQTIKPLDVGGGLKFTTAEYFLPDGESIEGVGVEPDRVVKASARDVAAGDDAQLDAAQQALQSLLAANGGG